MICAIWHGSFSSRVWFVFSTLTTHIRYLILHKQKPCYICRFQFPNTNACTTPRYKQIYIHTHIRLHKTIHAHTHIYLYINTCIFICIHVQYCTPLWYGIILSIFNTHINRCLYTQDPNYEHIIGTIPITREISFPLLFVQTMQRVVMKSDLKINHILMHVPLSDGQRKHG